MTINNCSALPPLPLFTLPGYLSSCFPIFRFFFFFLLLSSSFVLVLLSFHVILILVVFQGGSRKEYVCICRLTKSAHSSFSEIDLFMRTDISGTKSQKKTQRLCPLPHLKSSKEVLSWRMTLLFPIIQPEGLGILIIIFALICRLVFYLQHISKCVLFNKYLTSKMFKR